jgi:hypothetical protein
MASREALKRQMLSNSLNTGGALGNYKSPIRQSFFGLTPEEQERVDYQQAQINNRMQAMAMTGSNRPTSLGRDLGFEVSEGFFKPFQKEFLPSKADKQAQENVDLQRELDQKLASMPDASEQDKLLEVGNFLIKKGRSADGLKILQSAGANKVKRSSAAIMASEQGLEEGTDDYKKFIRQVALKTDAPQVKGARAELFNKRYMDSGKAADVAGIKLQQLDQMYELVTDEKFGQDTGFKNYFSNAYSNLLGNMKIGDYQDRATFNQSFNSIQTTLLNEILQNATGPQTDEDAKRAKQALASLTNTSDANRFIVAFSSGLAKAQIEKQEFLEQWIDDNPDAKDLSGAFKAYKKHEKSKPTAIDSYKPKGAAVPIFYWEFERNARKRGDFKTEDIQKAWKQAKEKSYTPDQST